MEKIFMVYGTLLCITLAALVFFAINTDESRAQKLAKIRVRIDDYHRGGVQEPRDDDFEYPQAMKWIFAGVAFLLLVYVLSRM